MKKIIIFLFITTIILLSTSNNINEVLIPDSSIRFRIIANSNNLEDQEIKNKIKMNIEPIITDVLNKSNDINESRNNIKESIPLIKQKINEYNIDYKINYGNNYFPEKKYHDVVYPEGYYESLVITLGDGLGDNWWCVLFPPLCLLETQENNIDEVHYSLFIKEIVEKYRY